MKYSQDGQVRKNDEYSGDVRRPSHNRAPRRRGRRNRTWLIYVCAVLVICTALFLQFGGCGKKDSAGKSASSESGQEGSAGKAGTGKEGSGSGSEGSVSAEDEAAEKARAEAVEAAKNRENPLPEDTGDILMVVNKKYGLADTYVPTDLVTLTRCDYSIGSAETKQLKKEAAEALEEMFDASREAGYEIVMRTGYRSYGYQQGLYGSYVASDGQEAADTYSGRPGYSEHQSGLCCDVGLQGLDLNNFTGTDAAQWVEDHAHEFGFVVRYPEGKEDVTGYIYESWHIRYVGKDIAAYMKDHDMVLEEYLELSDCAEYAD